MLNLHLNKKSLNPLKLMLFG